MSCLDTSSLCWLAKISGLLAKAVSSHNSNAFGFKGITLKALKMGLTSDADFKGIPTMASNLRLLFCTKSLASNTCASAISKEAVVSKLSVTVPSPFSKRFLLTCICSRKASRCAVA